jgi:hypothetical protein
MTCWHCDNELDKNYQSSDFTFKFYHCSYCDKWYELRKQKSRVNGAVPVKMQELENQPKIPLAA